MKRWQARSIFLPTLGYNFLLGRILRQRHWWDFVNEQLILGALPFRRDAAKLKQLGVSGVINMCEEYPGPTGEYARLNIEQLWLPTIDFTHPRAEDVEAGAEFIERHVQASGKVYVHCKAGRARSATVVLWWLVRFRGMTPEVAQRHILAARPHVNPKIYMRPVIQDLYDKLKNE